MLFDFLDGTLSTQRRKLKPEDLSVGLSFCSPEQVLISVEFSDFAGKPNEEALLLEGVFADNKARITYRYRPNASVRAEHAETNLADYPTNLVDDDYTWEMVGGGEGDVILNEVSWHDSFGVRFHSESLQQGYLVVFMEALRDVEAKLSVSRTSPLQQILQQCDIPAEEQETLVGHLREANEQINASQSIQGVGTDLTASFRKAAGKTYTMGVTLGLGEPSFGDISRGLKVLLAGYGVTDLDPSRNGLGLNNVLYVSMLLNYFERRTAEGKTGGQLLLVEEPEAHLHPQLQRILLKALQERNVQVIITTHGTHITSAVPLASQIVLTSSGGPATDSVRPDQIDVLTEQNRSDLDRYLDATRSSLLYARKVILVEGPAEQFLIPPFVKHRMAIDLDDEGIAVIPIYGTHFDSYAKLFGPDGIRKKCVIIADGDRIASDANPEYGDEEDPDVVPDPPALGPLENEYVKVFECETTFEKAMTTKGTLAMWQAACHEIGAPNIAAKLGRNRDLVARDEAWDGAGCQTSVLNTAKRFGKARFAQVASKHVQLATGTPKYIADAIRWLVTDEPDD